MHSLAPITGATTQNLRQSPAQVSITCVAQLRGEDDTGAAVSGGVAAARKS